MTGRTLIASMVIWALVMIAVALVEPDTFVRLIPALGGGAAAHLVLLGAAVRNK